MSVGLLRVGRDYVVAAEVSAWDLNNNKVEVPIRAQLTYQGQPIGGHHQRFVWMVGSRRQVIDVFANDVWTGLIMQ